MNNTQRLIGFAVLALASAGCSGSDGKSGSNGSDGSEGATGAKGANGSDGSNGSKGATGDKGATGATGATGASGDKGATGDTGAMGDMGAMGLPGADGASGAVDLTQLTGDTVVYQLDEQNGSGVSGIVRFAKFMDNTTLVTVKLTGITDTGVHPSHLHVNSIAEGGAPAITLNMIDGLTGMAETVVSKMDDGTAVTYDELLAFDGFVNVHTSPTNGAPICGGDVGGNVLTGSKVMYDLGEMNASGITATLTLEERLNGFTLATLEVTSGTLANPSPSHIHMGMAGTGGTEIVSLGEVPVAGTLVKDIRALDDTTAVTFKELVLLDGSVMMHMSSSDAAMIAAGNLGSNDLNAQADYTLSEVASSGISGTVSVFRAGDGNDTDQGNAVIEVLLSGTTAGSSYPDSIYMGDVGDGGDMAQALTAVDGDSGMSTTLLPGELGSYDDVLNFDGSVQVHNPADDATVAEGGIGIN